MKIPWHLIVCHRKTQNREIIIGIIGNPEKYISVFYEVFMTAQHRLIETWGGFFSLCFGPWKCHITKETIANWIVRVFSRFCLRLISFQILICIGFFIASSGSLAYQKSHNVLLMRWKSNHYLDHHHSSFFIFWLCPFNSFDKIACHWFCQRDNDDC